MTIKLHTCGLPGIGGPHPCANVRKALEEQGVAFEVVKHPTYPRGRRTAIKELTGQDRLPVIELADGTPIREESSELIRRVKADELG